MVLAPSLGMNARNQGRSQLKYIGKRLMLGAALVVIVMLAAVTRTRAVQEWYHTVTVQGHVTMLLLDEQARVDGLLLDGGSQIRLSPRMAEAVIARMKTGDTVSVVGRGGRTSSFGRAVHARELTINGQTLTAFDEPHHGPPPGPGGPHGPQRGNAPPPPPRDAGRGQVPPPPPPPGAADTAPPLPSGPGVAGPDATKAPAPPTALLGPTLTRPDAPPPPLPPDPESHRVTARGKVQAFLVGERGEVTGLALGTGEQVHFGPRIGEVLTAQSTDAHPDSVVEGDAMRSDYGTIVRPTRLTVGARTLIVP
jgi:hypothetical protein